MNAISVLAGQMVFLCRPAIRMHTTGPDSVGKAETHLLVASCHKFYLNSTSFFFFAGAKLFSLSLNHWRTITLWWCFFLVFFYSHSNAVKVVLFP